MRFIIVSGLPDALNDIKSLDGLIIEKEFEAVSDEAAIEIACEYLIGDGLPCNFPEDFVFALRQMMVWGLPIPVGSLSKNNVGAYGIEMKDMGIRLTPKQLWLIHTLHEVSKKPV